MGPRTWQDLEPDALGTWRGLEPGRIWNLAGSGSWWDLEPDGTWNLVGPWKLVGLSTCFEICSEMHWFCFLFLYNLVKHI